MIIPIPKPPGFPNGNSPGGFISSSSLINTPFLRRYNPVLHFCSDTILLLIHKPLLRTQKQTTKKPRKFEVLKEAQTGFEPGAIPSLKALILLNSCILAVSAVLYIIFLCIYSHCYSVFYTVMQHGMQHGVPENIFKKVSFSA